MSYSEIRQIIDRLEAIGVVTTKSANALRRSVSLEQPKELSLGIIAKHCTTLLEGVNEKCCAIEAERTRIAETN